MERIFQKIGKINEYVRFIRSVEDQCLDRFQTDLLYRGALLHYLYLLADSCISLGEMVIKHKGLRLPQSYQEVFDILGEQGILESKFAFDFAKIAGFRNFLSHDYEKIDPECICRKILSKLNDVDKYISQIKAALGINI